MMELWTALYLPARPNGSPDPSRFDRESKDAAWQYVYSRMCDGCKKERQQALEIGEVSDFEAGIIVSLYPPCCCEWLVLKTSDYEKAETFDEISEAAGWKKVYERSE